MKFQMGAGCTYCNLSGYRGRAAIYELIEVDRPLADAIRRGDPMEFAELVARSAKASRRSPTQRSTWRPSGKTTSPKPSRSPAVSTISEHGRAEASRRVSQTEIADSLLAGRAAG